MKSNAGRPLKGDQKRIRTSFTLHPKWNRWLGQKGKTWKMTKSDALEKVFEQVCYIDSPGMDARFPVPQHVLQALSSKYGFKTLSLFGSVLGDQIDLLVLLNKKQELGLFELAELEKELSSYAGGKKVYIRTPKEITPRFRSSVLEKALPIYEKKAHQRS